MATRVYGFILILAASVPASAGTVGLDALLGGGQIIVGDWTFSSFTQTTNSATPNATVVDPSQVSVTDQVVGNGVQLSFDWNAFGGDPQLRIQGAGTQLYQFSYEVRLSSSDIGGVGLESSFLTDVDDNSQSGGLLEVKATYSDRSGFFAKTIETRLNSSDIPNTLVSTADGTFEGTDQPMIVQQELSLDTTSTLPDNFHEIDIHVVNFQPVPVPAAVWLLGSGLAALGFVARRRRKA